MFNNNANVVVTGGTFNMNEPRTANAMCALILDVIWVNMLITIHWKLSCRFLVSSRHPRPLSVSAFKLGKTSVYLTWLHGPAGAGKTAISRSLFEILHREGFQVASYFFFRTNSRRNSANPLMTTLAYQMACNMSDIQRHIANAIPAADPSIRSRSLRTQFEVLIIRPLLQITTNESKSLQLMLTVLNRLDECVDQIARNLVVEIIFDTLTCLPGYIKFLIISRPEYDTERYQNCCRKTFR